MNSVVKQVRRAGGWRLRTVLLCACVPAVADAQSNAARLVADLRAQKLYDRAHERGLELWQNERLSGRDRAELAIQLALTYTERALSLPPGERDTLWARADEICATFLDGWPENPRRLLVETQRALVALAHGQQAREELVRSADANDPAPIYLRIAVRGLSDVAAAVREQLIERRLRPRANSSPDALSVREMESLELNLAFHLARAQQQLGLCYPPRSADRDDALLQAVERLTPLAARTPPDELTWKARVDVVACLRELGQLKRAFELLNGWSTGIVPDNVAAGLTAERVRLLVATGQPDKAREAVRQASQGNSDSSGELAMAGFEAELAVWQQAARSGQAPDSRRLMALVDSVRETHGAPLGRRAELLLGRTLAEVSGRSSELQNPVTILAAAKHLYVTGQPDDAVASYDRAAQQLEQAGKLDEAFAASMTAAAIVREVGRVAAAGERYHGLALKFRSHRRAPEAHQLAILCAAERLRQDASGPENSLLDRYENLLKEHLAIWPDGSSSDEVRLWLGQLLAQRGDWADANRVLQGVRPTSERYAESVRIITNSYARQLVQLLESESAEAPEQREALIAAATQQLQPVITGVENRWPAQWSDLQRETALQLARLHLRYSSGSAQYAERLLTALINSAMSSQDSSAQEWHAAARPLLLLALVRNGKAAAAQGQLTYLNGASAAALVDTISGIDGIISDGSVATRDAHELGRLALEIIEMLDARRADIGAGTLSQIELFRATALAAVGDRATASAKLAALAAQSPDDGDVQERYAKLLAASDSTGDLRQALESWTVVEQRSRRGGPRWRRARTARIELLNRLGNRSEADKLLRLTRLLYRDWESSDSATTKTAK